MVKRVCKIGILIGLYVMTTAPLWASPLYGGYNGQSTSWVDAFFFGIDDQQRWWVRVPVVLQRGVLRVNCKYEYDGVVSAELVIRGLENQGDILLGIDTTDLTWQEIYGPTVSGGSDSRGNSWNEQSIFGFLGTGSDNHDNLWGFIGAPVADGLSVRAGMTLAPPEMDAFTMSRGFPLQVEAFLRIAHFIKGFSDAAELRWGQDGHSLSSLELPSLLAFACEQVFTQERRDSLEDIVNWALHSF